MYILVVSAVIKYKMQMSSEAGKLLTVTTTVSGAFTIYQANAKNLECVHSFNHV